MIEDLVTIVIPCRNEVKHIKNAIEAALSSEYPKEKIEIIIVDGMSDDGTRELLKTINYPNVKVIDNINRTTPYAFNLGIENSNGEYIMIHGSHTTLSKNYIKECVNLMKEKPDVHSVGNGRNINAWDSEIGRIIAQATYSVLALGFGNSRKISADRYTTDGVDTPLFRRRTFEIVGLFDPVLTRNQDDDMSYRIKKAGLKMYATNKIYINYLVRGSYKKLYKQYSQYGYWKVYTNRKHHTVTTMRQLVPAMFILFLILGAIIAPLVHLTLLYVSIILFYLVVTFVEGFRVAKNIKDAFLTQYAFFCFHFGYGFGYLKGIFDFLILHKQPSDKMQKLTR